MSKIYLVEKSQLEGVGINFCTCSTPADTAAKTVDLSGFTLKTGAQVAVKFTYANTVSNPTLNINDTGAKPMYCKGRAAGTADIFKDGIYRFVYDGTRWNMTEI